MYQRKDASFMAILFVEWMSPKFKLGMKWKWCEIFVGASNEACGDQSFSKEKKSKKKNFMTILLVKWLIREFTLKIKYEIKIYVIVGVWQEWYEDQTFKEKHKKQKIPIVSWLCEKSL
jgi:hypothetical protein